MLWPSGAHKGSAVHWQDRIDVWALAALGEAVHARRARRGSQPPRARCSPRRLQHRDAVQLAAVPSAWGAALRLQPRDSEV